jgi:tetratricopeptide (TPR) repeat protein
MAGEHHPAHHSAAPASEKTTAGSNDAPSEVGSEISALRSDLDKLRATTTQAGLPWYRQVSVIVSLVALVFSIAATYYANEQTARQNDRAARTELGQLIQRLSALPKENADLTAKYANNRSVLTSLSGSINAENLVLAQQAADVIDRIPDQVSAAEYFTVASALKLSAYYSRSQTLIDRGLRVDADLVTREGLLRLKGTLLFDAGDVAGGRAQLQQALELWRDESTKEQATGNAYTEILWSGLERQAGNCQEAESHLSRARAAAERVTPAAARTQITETVRAAEVPCG